MQTERTFANMITKEKQILVQAISYNLVAETSMIGCIVNMKTES
jgi:hypothetical protein